MLTDDIYDFTEAFAKKNGFDRWFSLVLQTPPTQMDGLMINMLSDYRNHLLSKRECETPCGSNHCDTNGCDNRIRVDVELIGDKQRVYGIWNMHQNCWMANNEGSRFKTLDADVAFDNYNNLKAQGAKAIVVREIPPKEIE